jgi:hypothetical protein
MTEHCAGDHDHKKGEPICSTRAALEGPR